MNAARAECRKLLTLPSLWLTGSLTLAGTVLLTWAYSSAEPLRRDAALAPLGYSQAGFLVLGVLAAASEYQAGDQIRTTLLAMPRRLRLFAAKAGALAAVTLPLAVATAATGTVPAGDAARAPVAAGYLVLTTMLAAAVGGLVRHAVPATGLLLGLYFIAGPLLRTTSGALAADLPDTAVLDPARGTAGVVLWALSALALGALAFQRRDAGRR